MDLRDNKNMLTVIEGNSAESEIYNREELIEIFNEIIEMLRTYD